MNVKNSVAFVSGANRGIGRAFVEQLLRQGAKQVYAGARDTSKLAELVSAGEGRVVAVSLDISVVTSAQAAAQVAGDVTLLINNAGALAGGSQLTAEVANIRGEFETNYFGLINMARAFAPVLEANKPAAMVNVLSVVSLASMPPLGGYSASKAAAHSLTLALRGELSKRGIAVHGTYPGPVDTDMAKGFEMAKTSPADVAAATLAGVEAGSDYILPDVMAQQVYQAWSAKHTDVENQFGSM